jgi:hypothetical protein
MIEERNQANERNTAQFEIDGIIRKFTQNSRPNTNEILIYSVIYGHADFSALRGSNVTRIVFKEKGGVTGVTGLPSSLIVFECERQLLVEMPNLPASIETVKIGHNAIPSVDLAKYARLKVFDATNCQLKQIQGLPNTLEELRLNDNLVRRLNLNEVPRLRVLHCLRNRMLRIENIPPSLVDLKVEEGNPLVELDYDFIPSSESARKGTEPEYIECLEEYFKLKSKYEESVKSMREIAKDRAKKRNLGVKETRQLMRQLKPKCVNCRRPVGTVFKHRKQRYIAYCGDTEAPCPLKIELFRGEYLNNEELLYNFREQVYELKESIIEKKMDSLFGYVDEATSVKEFKELIEKYHLDSSGYKDMMDTWDSMYYSDLKKELVKGKVQVIHELKSAMNTQREEYEKTGNKELIHSIMDVYNKEYLPEVHNLRRLNYEMMEVVSNYADIDSIESTLVQRVAAIQKVDFLTKEVPRVIQFSVTGETEEGQPAINV